MNIQSVHPTSKVLRDEKALFCVNIAVCTLPPVIQQEATAQASDNSMWPREGNKVQNLTEAVGITVAPWHAARRDGKLTCPPHHLPAQENTLEAPSRIDKTSTTDRSNKTDQKGLRNPYRHSFGGATKSPPLESKTFRRPFVRTTRKRAREGGKPTSLRYYCSYTLKMFHA